MLVILMIASILTLLLNVLLVYFLIKDKFSIGANDVNDREVVNFSLMPTIKDAAVDTEVLHTEILSRGDQINADRQAAAVEK